LRKRVGRVDGGRERRKPKRQRQRRCSVVALRHGHFERDQNLVDVDLHGVRFLFRRDLQKRLSRVAGEVDAVRQVRADKTDSK